MRSIRIATSLLEHSKNKLVLGVVTAKVKVEKKNEELWEKLQKVAAEVGEKNKTTKVLDIAGIKALTETYKSLGLKLSDYKGSNEALLKRVAAGKGFYQINSVVDANNLVSFESLRSVGSYDVSKLSGDIEFRIGKADEIYASTSKESFKLAKLSVLSDDLGPFGSPTSDSKRALISEETTDLMTVIFSFDGEDKLQEQMELMGDLLKKYAAGQEVQCYMVRDQPVVLAGAKVEKQVGLNAHAGLTTFASTPMSITEKEEQLQELASDALEHAEVKGPAI